VHERSLVAHAGYHALDEDELGLWKEFEHEKRENSVVDFDDMLHLVVRRMRGDPKFLTALQKQFDHVLMDEAQDTNPVQWEFINGLLRPDNMNFYAVGDMSQSIYGFNGAVPDLLRQYSKEWRGVQPDLYRIARNHRSVPEVVAFANMIQNKMTRTIPLQMESWRGLNGDHGKVSQLKGKHAIDIAATIASEIQAGVREGIAYKDNALLVRAAVQIRDLEGELVRRRIPYVVRGGRGLLATEEVRDVMAYLRLAANHKDFMSLARAASAPRCGVGDAGLESIRKTANEKYEGDLIKAAEDFPKLAALRGVIEHATLFKANPIAALDKVMTMTGYRDYVKLKYKRESNKVHTKLENLERFGTMVIMLAQDGNFSLDDLIFQLTLDRGAEEAEERKAVIAAYNDGKIGEIERDAKLKVIDQGSVTITTIHQAKGLEWKRVYVTNVVEGSIPHKFSMGSDEEIEEERRLFYVATTRAKDICMWCVPKAQLSPDGTKITKLTPSRFLTEIGG
jgi:DNA helicase-2/ATP-dependent DNA helicase PcrA